MNSIFVNLTNYVLSFTLPQTKEYVSPVIRSHFFTVKLSPFVTIASHVNPFSIVLCLPIQKISICDNC